MIRTSLRICARQLACGLALGTFAGAAQADPLSLQGACHLTSIVAGQAQCQLEYSLTDSLATGEADIKAGAVKIDNIFVHRYWNDSVNPVLGSVYALNGSVAVSCGASHVVSAFITRLGVGMVSQKVGALPAVVCPTAP